MIFEANLGGRLADPLRKHSLASWNSGSQRVKRGGAWPPIRNPFKFYQSGRGESSPENWNDFGGGFGANLGEFVTEFWWILEANFGGFGANLGGIWKRRLKLPWNCALGIALKNCP